MRFLKVICWTLVLSGAAACWALAQPPQNPPLMPTLPGLPQAQHQAMPPASDLPLPPLSRQDGAASGIMHVSDVIPMTSVSEQDAKPPVLPDKDLNPPVVGDQQKKPGIVAPGQLKDPTKAGAQLQDAINYGKSVVPGGAPATMPIIALRGRVIVRGQDALAVLEMDGRFYVVGKGSMLVSGGNLTITVEDVTSMEVRIGLGASKEVLILR